jgi:hypothetical protein
MLESNIFFTSLLLCLENVLPLKNDALIFTRNRLVETHYEEITSINFGGERLKWTRLLLYEFKRNLAIKRFIYYT